VKPAGSVLVEVLVTREGLEIYERSGPLDWAEVVRQLARYGLKVEERWRAPCG